MSIAKKLTEKGAIMVGVLNSGGGLYN